MKQKKEITYSMPTKEGLFLASSDCCGWFNLIVRVSGEAPFLKMDAWDRGNDELILNFRVRRTDRWGPEIEVPSLFVGK